MNIFKQRYITPLSQYAQDHHSLKLWWVLAIVSYAIARALQFWLDQNYAASLFPVPFYVGQTTFDATELKGYYQYMIDHNTLPIYIRTQIIDYAFMAGTFLSFFCLSAAMMRSVRALFPHSMLFKVACVFVWLSPLAALMDAIENLISFVMLSSPTNFPAWLVYPYSSFAVAKFGIFAATYLWALILLVLFTGYGFFYFARLINSTVKGEAN